MSTATSSIPLSEIANGNVEKFSYLLGPNIDYRGLFQEIKEARKNSPLATLLIIEELICPLLNAHPQKTPSIVVGLRKISLRIVNSLEFAPHEIAKRRLNLGRAYLDLKIKELAEWHIQYASRLEMEEPFDPHLRLEIKESLLELAQFGMESSKTSHLPIR